MDDSLSGSPQNLSLTLGSGEVLDVREFSVDEDVSRLFDVRVVAVSTNVDVDFPSAIGQRARFEVRHVSSVDGQTRHWAGVCSRIEQTAVEESGLSTYAIHIVPTLWLLGQSRSYRIFQDRSELQAALDVLSRWGIEPQLRLDRGSYVARRYRVQYAESDLAFVSRMLEQVGIVYYFDQAGTETVLVLADAPNRAAPRAPLDFIAAPNERVREEYVTAVSLGRGVRPGRYTQSDVDWRRPLDYPLSASASKGGPAEADLERYHHDYGSFLWKGGGGDTPAADDRGAARTSEAGGAKQVQKRLDAERADARRTRFKTTAYDLRPGQVMSIAGHPREEIGAPLLLVGGKLTGSATGEWTHTCEAVFTDVDFRPSLSTPRPHVPGVESATVTGPAGEEIHTDEFGRVRVHFHWDREGAVDETSSCWIPVSQPWAGAGMGAICLPRVGQEVIVDFLGGDPDRPVVLGSVFTATTPPPYELPRHKSVSGLRSETYPRRKQPVAPRMGGGVSATDLAGPPARLPAYDPPGDFSKEDATPEALTSSAQKIQALGPDDADVSRDANAIVFDDRAGKESLYIQAQRHLRVLAKHDFTGAIGGDRRFTVGVDDSESVVGHQNVNVGSTRTVEVGAEQSHSVLGNIQIFGQKTHQLTAKGGIASMALEGGHVFRSATRTVLKVGQQAVIVMLPDAIVVQAPRVFVAPGPAFMKAVITTGSVEEALAANEKANRLEAAAQAIADSILNSQSPDPMLNMLEDGAAKSAKGDERSMPSHFSDKTKEFTNQADRNAVYKRASEITRASPKLEANRKFWREYGR